VRNRPSPWLAVPVSLAIGGCAAILFVHTSSPRSGATPSTPVLVPASRPAATPGVVSSAKPAAPRPSAALPATVEPPATAPSVPPAPAMRLAPPGPAPASAAAPAAPTVTDAPLFGTVTVPRSRAGHRVWIDGRLVGESPGNFRVSCGDHDVRVGSHGVVRRLAVACGESVEAL
jgi:hypothetical protein